ncbi:MAG TPA: LpqB family beta-propeller domain-containing protein [Streptosporangiaceae bacterium]
MASASRPGWLTRARRLCLVAAAVASVAGCVSMPDSGPVGDVTASPQASAPQGLIGPFANPPAPGGSPSQIVSGFLVASASYTTSAIAREYLTGSASRQWNPDSVTVLNEFNSTPPTPSTPPATGSHAAQQTTVTLTGSVLATFNGSGEYVSGQGQGQPGSTWTGIFDLVRVGGQWRITNPPRYRVLNQDEFSLYYKAQDLYFLDKLAPPGPPGQVLVPDSVLVPLGVSASQLVISLVNALTQAPQPSWLATATTSAFPKGTQVLTLPSVDGATATVNLGGAVTPRTAATILDQVAAQLVWTLTGSPGSPPGIQSVVLEIDGHPWAPAPATPPCSGDRDLSLFQTQAAYECYNPYGSPTPASFYYIDRGQLWSRCGSQARAQQESVGTAVPVISRTGVFNAPSCDNGFVLAPSVLSLPTQPRYLATPSMVAVSPDGRYLAVVPPGQDAVYVGTLSGKAASFPVSPRLTAPDITSLSWDRDDDLWLAQNGDIRVLPAVGKEIPVAFDGASNVTGLSVAPDGVRIAVAIAPSLGGQLQLGAIIRLETPPNPREPTAQTESISVDASPTLGPSITRPITLTWYGADNLVVLNTAGTANALWEVPVDGQQAQQLPFTPSGTISITADGPANVLVAGLTGNYLAISTGLEGPWQQLGNQGQAPAYPG